MKKIIPLLMLLFFAASCIPTKRITYLQESNNAQDSLISIRKVQAQYRLQITELNQWQYEFLLANKDEMSFANAAAIAANQCNETTQSILAKLLTWLPEAKIKGCLY